MRSKEVSEKKVDKPKAAKALQEDILNSTLHCFGSHHKCKPEYCKTVREMHSPKDTTNSLGSNTVFSQAAIHPQVALYPVIHLQIP